MSAYGAHNQRGLVIAHSVRFASRPVWIEDLIDLVESLLGGFTPCSKT